MIYRASALFSVILFALIFIRLVDGYAERSALRPLATYYVTQGPIELGAPNIITGILITRLRHAGRSCRALHGGRQRQSASQE
jgi:multicomponent Na+:H+ antiporter subunit B